MTLPDDIPLDTPTSGTKSASAPVKPLRPVGPESGTRGGSQASGKTLGEAADDVTPVAGATSMPDGDLPSELPASPPDGMPGSRAALPPGSLPKPYLGPQGDENRNPPANAPAAPNPNETVENTRRNSAAPTPDRG